MSGEPAIPRFNRAVVHVVTEVWRYKDVVRQSVGGAEVVGQLV